MLATCLSKVRLFSVVGCVCVGTPALAADLQQKRLDIPPRLQWMANFGYCGEVSMLSAGLYYGQYASQYDVRSLASPGVAQNLEESQLLLSENDEYAAAAMRLKSVVYPQPDHPDARGFLTWVRDHIGQNHPVSIGLYMNQELFYGIGGTAGYTYDHIVPVTGVASRWPLTDHQYHADDQLLFSDNGMWTPSDRPIYDFAMSFSSLPRTRAEANAATGPVYSLTSTNEQYAIAITGIADDDGVTLPVRLRVQTNAEPAMADGATLRPRAATLRLMGTVSGLKPGVEYRLYRYDDFNKVPTARFNAEAGNAKEMRVIRINSGSTYSFSHQGMTSETVIYRVVAADAP